MGASYGVQNIPWGEYGRTNFYTQAPADYQDVAQSLGLDARELGANLRYLYNPTSQLYSQLAGLIDADYGRIENDYMSIIDRMMSRYGSTPRTIADVERQSGGGDLAAGIAREINDPSDLESAALQRVLSEFAPSQKAALRAKAGASRSLSSPDWYDQSIKAAWAPLVANAYSNAQTGYRNQLGNVAQGNNDLMRSLALAWTNTAGGLATSRAQALAGLRTAGLGNLSGLGTGIANAALNPRTTQVQSFGPAGTNMLGTMSNATGGFAKTDKPTGPGNDDKDKTGGGGGATGTEGGGYSGGANAYGGFAGAVPGFGFGLNTAGAATSSNSDGSYTLPGGFRIGANTAR